MNDFDVIVVGGGPAGSTASYHLGQAGVKTLLIEKATFPRDKPCGGGISARILTRFPYLRDPLKEIPVNWVDTVRVVAPSGLTLIHESRDPLYLMIRRLDFDDLLFRLAASKHVQVRQGVTVTGISRNERHQTVVNTASGETYAARVVIGADGANSVLARRSGLRTESPQAEFAIDMMEETPQSQVTSPSQRMMHVYYGLQGHFGYGYVFPKIAHLNFGVGYKLDYYLRTFNRNHYEHHSSFAQALLKEGVISGASDRRRFRAFPLPVKGPLARTSAPGILLCGDAGGFVNAFTAEGIYYAMVSGALAATAATNALRNGNTGGETDPAYERSWKQEIGEDLTKSVAIQGFLFSAPDRIDRIVKAALRDPQLAELLTRYATGKIGYREMKRNVIVRAFPFYVWHKLKRLFGALDRVTDR